jgi:hypothetical protein
MKSEDLKWDNTDTDINRLVSRLQSLYKKSTTIKECFNFNPNECTKTIAAHSIQRNGKLSLIAQEVNGQRVVYSFDDFDALETIPYFKFKPLGLAQASTFLGFCGYHDKIIFQPIEDQDFLETDEQCFLHCYRAIAHSYHLTKQQFKMVEYGYENNTEAYKQGRSYEWYKLGMELNESQKMEMKLHYQNKDFSELDYIIYQLDEFYPIMSSFAFTLDFSIKGRKLASGTNYMKGLMMSVFPEKGRTIVIIGAHKNDPFAQILMDELNSLPLLKLDKAISSLLITKGSHNTYFSPSVLNAFSKEDYHLFISLLQSRSMIADLSFNYQNFYYSSMNFFTTKFRNCF